MSSYPRCLSRIAMASSREGASTRPQPAPPHCHSMRSRACLLLLLSSADPGQPQRASRRAETSRPCSESPQSPSPGRSPTQTWPAVPPRVPTPACIPARQGQPRACPAQLSPLAPHPGPGRGPATAGSLAPQGPRRLQGASPRSRVPANAPRPSAQRPPQPARSRPEPLVGHGDITTCHISQESS